MGRAKGLHQAAATGARSQRSHRLSENEVETFSHERTCRYCGGSGKNLNEDRAADVCDYCEGLGVATLVVSVGELNAHREAAVAAIAQGQGLRINDDIVEVCLMGNAQRSDPRVGRILEAWILGLSAHAEDDAPEKSTLDSFGLRLTRSALKNQWPLMYETVLRAAVNNAVYEGASIDPYALHKSAICEAQIRFLASLLGALRGDEQAKKTSSPLQTILGVSNYKRFSEQLGARRLRRDRKLESILSASDYYQVFTAAQLELELKPDLASRTVRLRGWELRKHFVRLLEAKLAAQSSGREENAQLHALAAGIASGRISYKQQVTGSTTFQVWIEDGTFNAAEHSESKREYDTANPGDIEAANVYVKALKARVASNNDHLEQERFQEISVRLENFLETSGRNKTNVDALTEQQILADIEPGAIEAQVALQLLDEQS
jgi:hypothetical protein